MTLAMTNRRTRINHLMTRTQCSNVQNLISKLDGCIILQYMYGYLRIPSTYLVQAISLEEMIFTEAKALRSRSLVVAWCVFLFFVFLAICLYMKAKAIRIG